MKLLPELTKGLPPYDEKLIKGAHRIVSTLREAGFECFVAGGFVRDLVMGLNPSDLDIFIKGPKVPCDVKKTLSQVLEKADLYVKGLEGTAYDDPNLKAVYACPFDLGGVVLGVDLIITDYNSPSDPAVYTSTFFSADISRFWLDEKGEIQGAPSAQKAVLLKNIDFPPPTSSKDFKYFKKLFLDRYRQLGFTATLGGALLSPNDEKKEGLDFKEEGANWGEVAGEREGLFQPVAFGAGPNPDLRIDRIWRGEDFQPLDFGVVPPPPPPGLRERLEQFQHRIIRGARPDGFLIDDIGREEDF